MPEFVRYSVTVQLTMEVRGTFGHDEAAVRAVKAVRTIGAQPHEQPDGVSEPKIGALHVEQR